MNPRRKFLKLTLAGGAGAALMGMGGSTVLAQTAKVRVRVTLIRWPYT